MEEDSVFLRKFLSWLEFFSSLGGHFQKKGWERELSMEVPQCCYIVYQGLEPGSLKPGKAGTLQVR